MVPGRCGCNEEGGEEQKYEQQLQEQEGPSELLPSQQLASAGSKGNFANVCVSGATYGNRVGMMQVGSTA